MGLGCQQEGGQSLRNECLALGVDAGAGITFILLSTLQPLLRRVGGRGKGERGARPQAENSERTVIGTCPALMPRIACPHHQAQAGCRKQSKVFERKTDRGLQETVSRALVPLGPRAEEVLGGDTGLDVLAHTHAVACTQVGWIVSSAVDTLHHTNRHTHVGCSVRIGRVRAQFHRKTDTRFLPTTR